jgi:polyvinyl alcohol dehydrogenase (cytochrome)
VGGESCASITEATSEITNPTSSDERPTMVMIDSSGKPVLDTTLLAAARQRLAPGREGPSRGRFVAAVVAAAAFGAVSLSRAQDGRPSGDEVYRKRCAACHDQGVSQAPPRSALETLSAARILRALDFGTMMAIAYPMRRPEREAVARLLGRKGEEIPLPSRSCPFGSQIMSKPSRSRWSGWSTTASNTRFQSDAHAGLRPSDVSRLELKWAFGFPGDITAFGAPTVVAGTLFVGSAGGLVYALDAGTGCVHWVFQANGPVRSAAVVTDAGRNRILIFGDQIGWLYALDAGTGRRRWSRRPDPHEAARLTGSPVTHDGTVFVPVASWEETRTIDSTYPCCSFRGSIVAFDVRTGSVKWKTYLVGPSKPTGATRVGTPTYGPSGVPVWSTPTVDPAHGRLYVTTGDNYSQPGTALSDAVVALDLKKGNVVWSRQTLPNDVYNSSCDAGLPNCPEGNGPDHDFGASAMLVRTSGGKDLLVAGQKSGMVYAIDPDDAGRVLWQARVGKGGSNGGVQWGMATDGHYVYAAVSDLVRLPGSGHGVGLVGDRPFDPRSGGGLTALRVETGERAWFAPSHPCDPPRPGCSPAQPGAVSAIGGAVFSGSIDGHVRAYSTVDGRVLWDFDTVREYQTVNGVRAKGGSLDGAGPVIVDGMVFVNSGYPRNGGMAGNVLLAFGVRDP